MNRRKFVQLIAGTVTAIAAPMVAVANLSPATDIPQLKGDGFSNDSPALNALMRGELVEVGPMVDVSQAGLRDGVFHMPRGFFRLDTPIRFMKGENAYSDIDWQGSILCRSDKCKSIFCVGETDAIAEPLIMRNATVSTSTLPFADPSERPDWNFLVCTPVRI